MKRFKKLFTVAIMFALCLTFALISPISHIFTVLAAATTVGTVLTIKGLKDKGEIGTKIKIPKAKADSKSVTVVVKDPRGTKVLNETYSSSDVGDDDYFEVVPKVVGYYSVNYVVEDDITKSQTYYIYVDGTRPVIEFEENAKVYLPEKIYADYGKVELPSPIVKNGDAEEVDYELLIKGEVSASEKEKVYVSAVDPNYNDVTLTREDGKIYFEASKKDDKYVYGAYTFTYYYQDASGLTAKKYATVYVDKDYKEVVDKISMTFVWEDDSSMPTSGVLGQELTLPRPVAQDKSRDNETIQSYTQVKIDYIKNGDLDNAENWISYNGTEDKDFNADTFSFIPMNKTENGGYYRVEYTITDYFGHTIEKQVYQIKNVKDTVKPDVYIVNTYTIDDAKAGKVDLTDMSYQIPSKVIVNSEEIVIPAIYGIDNYASYENLSMARYFVSGSKSYRLDYKVNDGDYNTNETIKISSTNETTPEDVKNLLKTAGTYQIRYEVEDGVNTNKTITYDLVVLDRNFIDNYAPRITMPTISSVGLVGETISFDAPDVKDYASDSLQEANVDTARCNVEIGYFYGTSAEYDAFMTGLKTGTLISDCTNVDKYQTIKLDEETGKYTFEVPTAVADAELKVVVRATDNAQYGMPQTTVVTNNVAVKEASIRVVDANDHTTVPTFELSQIKSDTNEYDQNEVIKLADSSTDGKFVFTSNNADYTDISVKVYDPNGKEVSVRGISTEVNDENTKISVSGAEFTSTRYGQYIVAITATDVAGNSTVVSYALTVKQTIAPVINSTSSLPENVVVGQKVVIPNGVALDNGERIELQDANSISFDSENLDGYTNPEYSFVRATKTFIPKQAGTYKFVYVYSNSNFTVKSDIIEIQVSEDTSNEGKVKFDETEWYDTANLVAVIENDVETGEYELVAIPYLDVDAKVKSYSVKVQGPDSQDIAVKLSSDISDETLVVNQERFDAIYGAFEPTAKDGEYTVTYTVETEAGTTSITKTLRVGDLKEPTIEIENLDTNLPTNAKLGSELSIKAEDIKLSDEVSDEDDITLVVTIKETDGTSKTLTKSDGYYTYTFETAGSYVLKYTATDKAGNSTEKQTTIVVDAESAKETDTAVVWGAVLIVLCVAVCGSVVVFFIVNNRKKPTDDKNKTK